MKQNRNKSSILNAISALILTLTNGFLGIVATKMIILQYGSDFNGLNSTANQIINVLLIMEGGLALASNVSLFKPLADNNQIRINNILTVTRKKFRRIGFLFLIVGVFISIAYTFSIKSSLPSELIFFVISMTLVPAAFNLYYTTTYRVLLQTDQKEYVINLITTFTVGIGHILNMVLVIMNGSIWLVRLITMVCAISNCFFINHYVKTRYQYLKIGVITHIEIIKGTNDVMAQKVTGAIYTSAPIVFLSIFSPGGAVLASVYAVYNNVFNMIKSLLRALVDAPRHGIGQLIANESRETVWKIFYQYEYIMICTMFVMITTTYVLIMPFISIYTLGITDANYFDEKIALVMVLISVFEMIHIPSGHLMNMAGEFKIGKKFQIASCIILIVLMLLGIYLDGVYGVLLAVLLVSILLAILEIWFVHKKYFDNVLKEILSLFLPIFLLGIIVVFVEKMIFTNISGFIMFIVHGFGLITINASIIILISLLFYRIELYDTVLRIRNIMKK